MEGKERTRHTQIGRPTLTDRPFGQTRQWSRKTERQTKHTQTGSQTNRQKHIGQTTDRQTNRQKHVGQTTGRQTNKRIDTQMCIKTGRWARRRRRRFP